MLCMELDMLVGHQGDLGTWIVCQHERYKIAAVQQFQQDLYWPALGIYIDASSIVCGLCFQSVDGKIGWSTHNII